MKGIAIAGLLALGCNWDWNRMMDQPRCEPGDARPWFADGRCDQLPPAQTVTWRDVKKPPVVPPPTLALIERGADRFRRFCAVCHGLLGDGSSAVARDMQLRKPRSLHERKVLDDTDLGIFNTITEGYGMMPAYRAPIAEADRWAIVHYVRVLQRSQAIQLAKLPAAQREEAQRWLP